GEFTIPSKSPMPSYKGKLTDAEIADVVAYLMTLKGGAPAVTTNSVPAVGVTFERILNAGKEPQNWLTYSGGVNGQRHSMLTQITPTNVKNLELQWVWQAKALEKIEKKALVVDGVLLNREGPENVVSRGGGARRLLL